MCNASPLISLLLHPSSNTWQVYSSEYKKQSLPPSKSKGTHCQHLRYDSRTPRGSGGGAQRFPQTCGVLRFIGGHFLSVNRKQYYVYVLLLMRSANNLGNNCKQVHGRRERVRVQVNFLPPPPPWAGRLKIFTLNRKDWLSLTESLGLCMKGLIC